MTDRHPLVQALAVEGRLPREEITAAMAHIDETAPDLLAAVERAADGAVLDEAEENLAFFALFILGWARDQRLFAPLMRLLRRSDDGLRDLLGDAWTENLGKVIAGAFDGSAGQLFALARDVGCNEHLRGTVMGAIAFLTWAGHIDAPATRSFVEQFDDDRAVPGGEWDWFAWSMVVELLGWSDLAPRVEAAYRDGRVSETISDTALFRKGLAEAVAAAPGDATRFRNEQQGYIEDVLEELQRFRFGAADPVSPLPKRPYAAAPGMTFRVAEPERDPHRNVGRNDPCPCGSGKKYKKCCLAA